MTARRLTLLLIAAALLVPAALMAQPPDGGGQGQGPGFIRELLPPPGYLQLTDEQKETVKGMAGDLRAAIEPLREEERANREALRTALESDNPNARQVGQLVIDTHGIGSQIRDEMKAFGDAFRDVLDAEQQAKWDNFLELRRLSNRGPGPGGKAFRRHR